MEKIKKYKYLLLVFLFALISGWSLFRPGYFTHHDDIQFLRVYEMRQCLTDFQIPCRWNQNMAYGYGQPMFNYYSAFPYYIGALLSFFVGYLWSVKLLFIIPQNLAGVSMFLFVKELTGKRIIALAASSAYIFAPYHALDLYVRGALAESFAYALIPLIFYFSLKLVKRFGIKDFTGLALTVAFFLTTHNISTLITMPVFAVWCLVILTMYKKKNALALLSSISLGIGMSSFFLIPAFFEKNLITSFRLFGDALNFRIHFISLRQLFIDRSWGYGSSGMGVNDTMSFQIGYPLVFIVILSCLLFITRKYIKITPFQKLQSKLHLIFFYFIILFFSTSFMAHFRSAFIWEKFPILWYVQFPWRYLLLVVFAGSAVTAIFILMVNEKFQSLVAILLIISAILLNIGYFKPEKFINISESEVLSGTNLERQQGSAVWDYLPINAKPIKESSGKLPEIVSGNVEISNYIEKSRSFSFVANAYSQVEIEIPVYDYPVWEISINGIVTKHSVNQDGLIVLKINSGNHNIKGEFKNTPVRDLANIISVVSLLLLTYVYAKNKKYIK